MKNEPKLASKAEIREQLFKSMGPVQEARYRMYLLVINDLRVGVQVCKKAGGDKEAEHLQRLVDDLLMVAGTHAAAALAGNLSSEQELQAVDPLTGLLVSGLKDTVTGVTNDE